MPAPKVNYCLICEGIRREPNNKANILGFFGVLPGVTIGVGEMGKPVAVMLFLAGMSGPSNEVKIKAEIVNPDLSSLKASDDISFPALEDDMTGIAGFMFAGLPFSQVGKHSFKISIDGKQVYQETFLIQEGLIPDT